jgi:DNA-binding NarL/FixJ family response regulator
MQMMKLRSHHDRKTNMKKRSILMIRRAARNGGSISGHPVTSQQKLEQKLKEPGRKCSECDTILSIYNKAKRCSLHENRVKYRAGPLTYRQAWILRRLEQGWTHREIGDELGLLSSTISGYVVRIRQKMDVKTTTQAILDYRKTRESEYESTRPKTV